MITIDWGVRIFLIVMGIFLIWLIYPVVTEPFRKYTVWNAVTGLPCYGGRKFWTMRGASLAAQNTLVPQWMEIRKEIKRRKR